MKQRLKIVAPISRLEEVETLARAGADELYCGVAPGEWTQTRTQAGKVHPIRTINRRPSGNLGNRADLEQAVDSANANGCTLSLVLNAQSYSDGQLDTASAIGRDFVAMGGDALIVSDLGLIERIARWLPAPRLHVSSVATCRNAGAARFCRDLGASRLILPRDVTIAEACEIAAAVPDIEIEAFILNDACIFEEGHCNTLHLPHQLGGPICLDDYRCHYRRRNGKALGAALAKKLAANDAAYQQWLWYRFSCGFSTTASGQPYGPCGLCALPALLAGGLAAVKIAGREAPTRRKFASVDMVRAVLDRVAVGEGLGQIRDFAQHLRPSVEHCQGGQMCYYPEVLGYPE
jgi:collagenase-like PrtC family protease